MHLNTAARHAGLRYAIGAVHLAALPLYAAEETISRARRDSVWTLPGLDRLDRTYGHLERKAIIAGDIAFLITAKSWSDKACAGINAALDGLTAVGRRLYRPARDTHTARLAAQRHDLDEVDARFAALAPGHPARPS